MIQKKHWTIIYCLIVILSAASQLESARSVQDFDFDWKFLKADMAGAQAPEFDDSDWRDVQLPHDWSIEGPYSEEFASGTGFLPGGIGWYRKTFTLNESDRDKRIYIEFGGVYNNSEVWINGKALGKRPFGYISFQYELTPHVTFGEKENVLAVRVDHSEFADSRWYTGSGIYRHVRLCIKDPLHIEHWGVFVTTPVVNEDSAKVHVETSLKNDNDEKNSYTLTSKILNKDGVSVSTSRSEQELSPGASKTINNDIDVDNPALWSPESPVLYTLVSEVHVGDELVDSVTTTFGIRRFHFDPDKGFFLNGKNMKLKGVCLHHDAGPVGAAVPEEMWERRLQTMKEMGSNAIRCSHNPPAPEFLDLCDRMGFLVQDEAFDEFTPTKRKWVKGWNRGTPSRDGYGDVFEEWAVRDISDMVKRDRNHPSIIMWSIGNEVDYRNDPFSHPILGNEYNPNNPSAENLTRYGKKLVEAVKALDTTRPTTAALATAPMSNAVGFADILDIVGYNYQEQYYDDHHVEFPDRVLYGSENSNGLNAWQAVEENDFISGQFVWTGIDYLGEAGAWPTKSWTRSFVDLCGFKKPLAWLRQSIWADKPMVYIACREGRRRNLQSHWNWSDQRDITVECYTNCEEAELFLNDQSLGSQSVSQARNRTLRWTVPYQAGILKAVGKNGQEIVCEYILKTAGDPQKVTLDIDKKTLSSNGKDICHVVFKVTDENGIQIPDAEDQVTFNVTGPATIIALGNANPESHESHQGNQRTVWQGRGLAILRSERKPGTVTVTASAPGLDSAQVTLQVK